MQDGRSESSYAYALCYRCHDRTSLLNDESFPYHSLHILGQRSKGLPGTSCFTCHDAHGSTRNQYLIRFNEEVVEPNLDGKLEFKAQGVASRRGSCALRCHEVEHDPKEY
jgi:cytochrome c553